MLASKSVHTLPLQNVFAAGPCSSRCRLVSSQPCAQGNRFDHADRLFHSLPGTWQNCLHGSSDVKELLPEFFCQPEFLRNSNAFSLGTRQVRLTLALQFNG